MCAVTVAMLESGAAGNASSKLCWRCDAAQQCLRFSSRQRWSFNRMKPAMNLNYRSFSIVQMNCLAKLSGQSTGAGLKVRKTCETEIQPTSTTKTGE
jgi:hypothetical protein